MKERNIIWKDFELCNVINEFLYYIYNVHIFSRVRDEVKKKTYYPSNISSATYYYYFDYCLLVCNARKTVALAQMVRNDEILRLYNPIWLLWPKVFLFSIVCLGSFSILFFLLSVQILDWTISWLVTIRKPKLFSMDPFYLLYFDFIIPFFIFIPFVTVWSQVVREFYR